MSKIRQYHNGLLSHFWEILNNYWDKIPLVFPEKLTDSFEKAAIACINKKDNPITIKIRRALALLQNRIQSVPAKIGTAPIQATDKLLRDPGPIYYSFYYTIRSSKNPVEDFIERYIINSAKKDDQVHEAEDNNFVDNLNQVHEAEDNNVVDKLGQVHEAEDNEVQQIDNMNPSETIQVRTFVFVLTTLTQFLVATSLP